MSSHPSQIAASAVVDRLPVTLPRLAEMKRLGEAIVMVTAYDFPSARAAEAAGVDVVLVGDSGAMTVLGYPSTVGVSLDEMIMLARAARRGLRTPFLVGDLPFGSYEISDEQAVATALRFVKEAGCDAVKLEGGGRASRRPAPGRGRSSGAGIPVMGHVGLTPQTATALGGYRAQGRSADGAARVADDALALQEAGCFSIVFEAIPSDVAALRHGPLVGPGDRDRRRPRHGRPGARLPRPARHPRGARRAFRQALRRACRTRWSRASSAFADDVRTRRYPAARARLLDRRAGARRVSRAADLAARPPHGGAPRVPLRGTTRVPGRGSPVADLRPEGPRLLQPLRGGGRQRPARGRAARRDAALVSRAQRPRPRDPALRAGGRPDHLRHHPAPQLDVRDADRPRGHPRSGLGPGRHRRPHRGGRRLPRAVPHRGPDGAGPAPGAHPHGVLPADQRGRARGSAASRTSRTTPARSTASRPTATG